MLRDSPPPPPPPPPPPFAPFSQLARKAEQRIPIAGGCKSFFGLVVVHHAPCPILFPHLFFFSLFPVAHPPLRAENLLCCERGSSPMTWYNFLALFLSFLPKFFHLLGQFERNIKDLLWTQDGCSAVCIPVIFPCLNESFPLGGRGYFCHVERAVLALSFDAWLFFGRTFLPFSSRAKHYRMVLWFQ